jgi:putative endonuclease
MSKPGYVYILSNGPFGILYVGVTSNLVGRIWQHREGLMEGFSKRHGLKRLVYFEIFEDIEAAIAREKAMKKWRRGWKLRRICDANPEWRDLWDEITGLGGMVDWGIARRPQWRIEGGTPAMRRQPGFPPSRE